MKSKRTSYPAFYPEKPENESNAAVGVSHKQLCDVIVWAPIVHVDGDDRERYHVICTHQTRGFLGASPFIALSSTYTIL